MREPEIDAVSIAVLGDSDSHAFQDKLSFPIESGKRGGAYRASTFQWTEVLAMLRGDQIDLGRWGTWGNNKYVAAVKSRLGLESRSPRKQDFNYNFSVSGAGCEALIAGSGAQAKQLLRLMDDDPRRWSRGFVVIRIGVNSFGLDDSLEALSKDPDAPAVATLIAECVKHVRQAVSLIHARHPATRIVLVGIFDNSHWPNYFDRWQSALALENIAKGLESFDGALRAWVAADQRIAFFDDRAWFASRWGGRDSGGRPAYKAVKLASGFEVINSAGDSPNHSVLSDGHAGTAWNAMWAQSLVNLLDTRFGAHIAPITDSEIDRFVAHDTRSKLEAR